MTLILVITVIFDELGLWKWDTIDWLEFYDWLIKMIDLRIIIKILYYYVLMINYINIYISSSYELF